MAKGNWKPDVIRPRTRCRLCGIAIRKNEPRVYLDGINPSHKTCAENKNRQYTETFQPKPEPMTIEEDRAADAFEFWAERRS